MIKTKIHQSRNISKYVPGLLIILMVFTTGCTASNTSQNVSKTDNVPAVKGPYELAAEQNIPSVVSYQPPEDTLRFINEPIFKFNDIAYRYVLSPLASGYENIVPEPVDKSISNFFYNLREPLYAINHLLQGDIRSSGKSIARVLINSTVGVLGLFDAADNLVDVERNKTTFGDTLASYGVGYGTYVVLPLLGPSDLRDTASLTFNYFAHPLNYINDDEVATQLLLADGVQAQIPILAQYPNVLADVENPYEFVRNLYMQNLLRDGQTRRNEVFKTEEQKKTSLNPVLKPDTTVE
jgi:phospholipid-binding lipoprotein MlaA